MKIRYTFATNDTTEIEVSEEWGAFVLDLDRLDYKNDQRETRRHFSLDAFNLDDALFSSEADVEGDVFRAERYANLNRAIAELLPDQQRLIREIFYDSIPAVEIARREGVGKTVVSNHLSRALKSLRKNLK